MQEIVAIKRVAKGEASEFCVESNSARSKYCVSGIFAPVGLVSRVKSRGLADFCLVTSAHSWREVVMCLRVQYILESLAFFQTLFSELI